MNYTDGRDIVQKLQAGLRSGVPARFDRSEAADISHLIETSMVRQGAFDPAEKTGLRLQNLAEGAPVTDQGKQLFS